MIGEYFRALERPARTTSARVALDYLTVLELLLDKQGSKFNVATMETKQPRKRSTNNGRCCLVAKRDKSCAHDREDNSIMAWYESSIFRQGLLESIRTSSLYKPISAFHTDPYEKSSGVFHVL